MKKLAIHGIVVFTVVVVCDFSFNEGRASRALIRDMEPASLARDGKQAGAKLNAFFKSGM